jgi:hypothetical protein
MCKQVVTFSVVVCATAVVLSARQQPSPGVDWPQFRGPAASGVAEGHTLPTRWNVETGENVRWKAAVPALAHSSPIVWRNHVCLTHANSTLATDGRHLVAMFGSEGLFT